jgi:hypothetical protein
MRRYATRERFGQLNPALKGRAKFKRRYAALPSKNVFAG